MKADHFLCNEKEREEGCRSRLFTGNESGRASERRFVRLKVKGMRERKFLFPRSTMGIRGIRAGGK